MSFLPVRDAPRSPLSESFRMLQANLRFSQADRRLQAIAVASSVPGEGKSTLVANLGLALAEVGQHVLIVDADLRNPSQHGIWEYANAVGLSNLLVGESSLEQACHPASEGLDLLTAGQVPPNPVALLDSQRLATLLQQWRQAYDYVLLDVPPLQAATDAVIVGKLTDGTLLVVRPGVAECDAVEASRDTLARLQQPVVGMVANGVNPRNERSSYYHYYNYGNNNGGPPRQGWRRWLPGNPFARNGKGSQ
ncbi:MAG: hypothetical protein BRC58_03210 [Cyanobacteria bacterium QS_8_64_29]|nr:MAG: hypothetical protein BRC58_03210 [Cyanobacteria bacterium QS_8_64_29]